MNSGEVCVLLAGQLLRNDYRVLRVELRDPVGDYIVEVMRLPMPNYAAKFQQLETAREWLELRMRHGEAQGDG